MPWSKEGNIRGPAGTGGGGGATVLEKSADQAITATALTDISDFTIPIAAGDVITVDGFIVFQSAATTTGFRFAAAAPLWVPSRFLMIFEYQTSKTAWATFTQNDFTTFMAATTSSYIANAAILCRVSGQVEAGLTGGSIQMQASSEVAGSAITIRRGNVLRYY